jgi:hypothetical protein
MEIKTSRAIPMWLADMLSSLGIRRKSFSKYGTEFRRSINDPDRYAGKIMEESNNGGAEISDMRIAV